MPLAFTRQVSPRIVECALTHLERRPIDPGLAVAQHQAYEQALRDAGYEIVRLPDLPDDPDAVFVEDTALLLGDHAIITRPGAASRANEVYSTAAGLTPHFNVRYLSEGTLDGGDVLPGFSLSLRELFAMVPRATARKPESRRKDNKKGQ